MKFKLLKFICFFLLFFSFSITTKALSSSYKDIVKDIVNIEEIETNVDKINIYFIVKLVHIVIKNYFILKL